MCLSFNQVQCLGDNYYAGCYNDTSKNLKTCRRYLENGLLPNMV